MLCSAKIVENGRYVIIWSLQIQNHSLVNFKIKPFFIEIKIVESMKSQKLKGDENQISTINFNEIAYYGRYKFKTSA